MANFVDIKRFRDWFNPVLAVLLFLCLTEVAYSAEPSAELRSGGVLTQPAPGQPVDCSSILGTEHPAAIYCDD